MCYIWQDYVPGSMDYVEEWLDEEAALPHYCGSRMPNCDYHQGSLPPVKGVRCYQVARANRTHPQLDDCVGGTYKHGADLAFRNGTFYLHYFTNPMSEHTGPVQSILASSRDGSHWDSFRTAFPPYRLHDRGFRHLTLCSAHRCPTQPALPGGRAH